MKIIFCGLVFSSLAIPLCAQTTRTWNGSAGTDWFNASNWTPTGVPTPADTINFSSGTLNLTSPFVVSNRFNWSGGTLTGSPLVIAGGGIMNLGGTGTKYLQNVLTNAGTVTWTNGQISLQNNATASYKGAIENLAGALWDIRCDEPLGSYWGGTNAYFHNLGTLRKSAAGGTTDVGVSLYNGGSVLAQQGVLNFQNGSIIEGDFTASAGARIAFSGGAFTYSSPPVLTGPGPIQFTGGSLKLLYNVIPNLQFSGGTLSLGPNFQGGTITNLTLPGTTLSGNYSVTGTLNCGDGVSGALTVLNGGIVNWSGGTITGPMQVNGGGTVNWNGGTAGGSVNVASGASLLLGGTATKYLQNVLTNAGTVTWTNGTIYVQNNGTASYKGAIENLAGAVWDIRCDQTLGSYWGGTNAYFHNLGTLQKSAAAGTTDVGVSLYNGGSVFAQLGVLDFENGGVIEGAFTSAAGAAITFSGGSFVYTTMPVLAGPGSIQFTGGTLTLLDNIIANLQLNGGTLSLGPNFQGGTITNLTLPGATLSGSYTVTGTLNCGDGVSGALTVLNGGVVNWSGGTITGPMQVNGGGTVNWNGGTAGGSVNVASGASLLLGGTATKYLQNVLTNAGTVTWTNGTIYVQNNGTASYKGAIENLAGGLWDIRCDQSLASYWGGTAAYFHNLGTMQKSAAGGTTDVGVSLYNGGSVLAQQGVLNFQNGSILEGDFAAAAGARITFSGGAFTYSSAPVLTGPGSIQLTGGSLKLLDNVIPNLQLIDGMLSLGPNFQGGTITNLTLPGATLSGSYTVAGTLNCGDGVSGALTVSNAGVVNWSAGTITGPLRINSGGIVNWNGGVAGDQVNVVNGGALVIGGTGTKYLQNVLTNAGTVTWTNGPISVQNNGTASYKGAIENLAEGLWDIRCDESLASYWSGSSAYFHNLGTLQKSAGSGITSISVVMQNPGTLGLFAGTINFNPAGMYAPTGATLNFGLSAPGQAAPLVVSGNLSLDGILNAFFLTGYTPKAGDTFALISCGTLANAFNYLNLPPAGNNLGWRVAYAGNGASLQVISNSNATLQISGSVLDNASVPVANITVFAFTTNSNNRVFLSTTTDAAGNYHLNVTNGIWRVGLQGLVARGYDQVPTQDISMKGVSQTANFVVPPYTGQSYAITVTSNPLEGGTASGGGMFLPGNSVTLIATANTSVLPYYFAGWTENGILQSSTSPYTFTAQRNRQIVANFTLPLFAVTASNNPSAAGTVSGTGSFVYGSTSVLRAQTSFGYNFGWWTENGTIIGVEPNLTNVVYTNRAFIANYTEANTNHWVSTATQPAGLSVVSGAGVYTNGQTGTFSAPPVVVTGEYDYFFQKFVLTNAVLSTNSTFTRTFSTTDPTNLQYVAVYASLGIIPAVTNVTVNFPNPVPATTNLQLTFRFDRTMDTNFTPQVELTNSAPGALQPIVPAGGIWGSVARSNDTFYAPKITLSSGMDGTLQVFIGGARDVLGVTMGRTNVNTLPVDATPPVLSNVAASPSVLSAFVTWTSSEPSSSKVDYGTSAAYGSSSGLYSQLVTAHGVTLNNLNALTTYHYRVRSRDQAGNEAVSGDNTFTTFAAPDLQVTALAVTPATGISGGNLLITWTDTNSGSGTTFSYWYDQVVVTNRTTGQTLLNSSQFYDANANGPVAPGGSRNRQLDFQLPNGPAGAGDLQIIVTVNSYASQYEANSQGSAKTNNTASVPLTSALATYPDLQVTSLLVTNSQIQSGSLLGLTWLNANTGARTVSNSFHDRIVISNETTGQNLTNTDLIYDSATAPIPAGQSAARRFSFKLPDGAAGSGTLRITLTADGNNKVFEYNAGGTAESNNSNSITVTSTLAPYPDLVATNIVVPATANAGQMIAVTWTETNQGSGPATNTWYDQVFLTGANAIGGGELLGTFAVTNSLVVNQSTNLTRTVTLPQFYQGDAWIVVKANASASIFELNPTNNSAICTQAVTITPTLLMTVSRDTVSEAAGTNSVLATATRNGNISAPLTIQLATVTGTNLFVPASVTIPAGQSARSFLIGPFDNFVSGNPILETITAAAAGFAPATAPLTILQDDPATLALNLSANSINENAGANAVTATVTRNANFATPLTVTLACDNPAALTAPASITIPSGQAGASFGLSPVPVSGLNDTRRANLSASAAGFSPVSARIDVMNVDTVQLNLGLLRTSVNKGAGSSADVGTVSIANALPASQSILLTVLSNNLVTAPSVVTIPAGARSVDFNIGVGNDNLSTGPQAATILAQPLTPGRVALTNGQAFATLQILDVNGPTLSLSAGKSVISKGSNTLVTVTRNTVPTNSVTVNLGSSPSDIVSLPATVTLPLNQSSATFTATGVLDNQQTGSRTVALSATAAGYNSAATPLTVSDIYLPDLLPTSITIATNALTSSQVTVKWVVANNGLGTATNGVWRDYIYLSTDYLGQGAFLVALVTNAAALPIGASYTNQATFYMPAAPGGYWVTVKTDGGNVVTELNKQNNTLVSSHPLAVSPDYSAAITNITPTVAPAGTPVVLSGWIYNATNNQPLANKFATVRITVNGARRVYTVLSDAAGRFSHVFQPLANEGGDYTAGADYPYVLKDRVQGTFVLLAMQAQPASLNVQMLPNVPFTGQLVLSNLSGHTLSGLSFSVPDLQGNLSAQFTFTNNTLPGDSLTYVDYTFQSPVTRSAQVRFTATATSTEGAQVSIPVTANIVPLVPQLVPNPGYLSSGMLVGEQTAASFDILNTGGASSGDLNVSLPTNLTWMALSSPAIIPSIPAGGKATVTLLLNPPADLPLTLYTGNLAAFNGNAGVSVQFRFRAVSSATGDLRVRATDDYTYYVAGEPNVTNATITIRDAFTSAVIALTNTDAEGFAYFTALPAGPYTVDGSAPKHNQFRGSVAVTPGTVVDLEAFMPRQLISYQWTVVPTEIQDHYRVVLDSVFETEVPVPNVVVAEPRVMVPAAPGVASQFTIKLSNHGLIAANGVKISVPNDPTYLVTPLVTDVGIIPAQSSVEIPVTVQLRSAPAPGLVRGASLAQAKDGGGCSTSDLNACLPDIPLGVSYYYVCGPNNVLQQRAVDLSVVCTSKDVYDCLQGLKETAESDNLVSLTCNTLSALLSCAGAELTPCQQAAISTACGAAVGALQGGLAGAGAGALSGGGSDILQCLCDLLKDVSLPSIPSSGGGGGGFGFSLGIIGGNGWYVSGGATSTGSSTGNCGSPVSPLAAQTQQTSLPGFLAPLRQPSRPKRLQGVCAQVRIRIEQSVTLTRTAFRGTLEIDNGGDTSITGIQVNLDFRDATNGAAASRFVVEGPAVSGMTGVDGTGTLAGGASGSAVYTFIPTIDAAPRAPATYQIGGTLSYVDQGELVTVPLLSAPITVYPEAQLDLIYFQQRDVYGDDPFTPQTEPSEPFALGLIVKNVGAGSAHNFQITSGQPQIVDNQKGLLINFKIIGTQVGSQPVTPSLSANLGDIAPGAAKEVSWEMLSTLQGKFISFSASFEHVDDLGSTNTSLIKSVEIHELIHPVLANRPIDDAAPDFLVNDIPDAASLPDVLYLSDGTIAAVNVVTNGTFDGQVGPARLQVHLQAPAGSGWNYFKLPDPGRGFLLQRVVRSDGRVLALTNNAWTTDRSFPSSSPGAVYENLVHLFDWAGTGSYTLYYHSTNTTPPAIVSVGPVTPFTQSGAVSSVNIVFSELVDANTFSYANLSLTRNGSPNLITAGAAISLTLLSNATYAINGLAPFTGADGNYQLTVNGTGIYDLWGNNAGNVSASTQWAKGNVAAVVRSLTAIAPDPRNTPVTTGTVDFSKPIDPATFTYQDLSLTLNGGPDLITSAVTVTPQSGTSFVIGGLGPLTGAEGDYVLTVNAVTVQDTGALAGSGSRRATWTMMTTGPTIAALEGVTTNPRNIAMRTLDVTFSHAIDAATFDYLDLTLVRDGGPNLITSDVTVTALNASTYRVGNISWVQGHAGDYAFSINAAGISDLAGNAGTGTASETWQIILDIPDSPTNLFIAPDLGIASADGLTGTNTITLFGTVAASNLTVRLYDTTLSSDLGTTVVNGTNFEAALHFTTAGLHRLRVNAIDIAGNVSPPSFLNVIVDLIPPTATIQQVSNPMYSPVSSIPVTFSKPINTNTLAPANFTVSLDGVSTFTPTLSYLSSNTVVLGNLGFFTSPLGTYLVTLRLAGVEDLAGNKTTNIVTMSWVHATTNLPPMMAVMTNLIVSPDRLVSFQVQAHDPNGDRLTYSLAAGSPADASIDPITGVFRWQPARSFAETVNPFTIIVTDSGSPAMSTNQSFTVTVLDFLELAIGATNLQAGQSASLPVYLASNAGVTNLTFAFPVPEAILTNWTLTPLAPQIASATLVDHKTNIVVTLQTVAGQSLQGTQLVSWLNFATTTNSASSYVALPLTELSGLKPTGLSYSNYIAHAGAVAVLEQQPLLLGTLSNGVTRNLILYGNVGNNYQVQYSTNLLTPTWQPWVTYTQTNRLMTLPLPATNPIIFYRLLQQ